MKVGGLAILLVLRVLLPGGDVHADDDVVPDLATHVKFDFAEWCKVGDHTFTLEKTTLAEIVRTLGGGTIRGNGRDAGKSEYYVDFVLSHDLVRFSSNAEMGGNEHELEEVEVRPLADDDRVEVLPFLHGAVTFEFGAEGMSFVDLVSKLGPAARSKNVVWYDHVGKVSLRDSSGNRLDGEVFSSLRAEVVGERVESIQLWRVTSL